MAPVIPDPVRRPIRVLGVLACAVAVACGASTTATGLGPEFAAAARDAHRFIDSQLIPQIGSPGFPSSLAASRAKFTQLQPKVTNDAERNVSYLLSMANALAGQSHQVLELSPAKRELAQEIAMERTQCMTEVASWLAGDASNLPALKAAPCLRRALQLGGGR